MDGEGSSGATVMDVEIIVGLAATIVVGAIGAVVSFAFKRAWVNLVELHTAIKKFMDPDTGIQHDVQEVQQEMRRVTVEMEHLRRNGHAFADRVSGIDTRLNGAAAELEAVRTRLRGIEAQTR